MRLLPSRIRSARFNWSKFSIITYFIHQYPDRCRSHLTLELDRLFESRCKSRPGEPTTARTNIYTCLCMQANLSSTFAPFWSGIGQVARLTFSGIFGVCRIAGRCPRKQCLPAPRRPPGSSCCLSLLAGGFWPTTAIKSLNFVWLLLCKCLIWIFGWLHSLVAKFV